MHMRLASYLATCEYSYIASFDSIIYTSKAVGHQITKCSMDTLSVLQTLVCLDTHFLSVQETLDKTWSVHKTLICLDTK